MTGAQTNASVLVLNENNFCYAYLSDSFILRYFSERCFSKPESAESVDMNTSEQYVRPCFKVK